MAFKSDDWFIIMSRVVEFSAKILILIPFAVLEILSSTRPISGGLMWNRISESPFLTALEILPTLAAVAGAKLPAGVTFDGHDMLPVLRGDAPSPRREMFWDWPDGYQAARVDTLKWVASTPRDDSRL